MSMVRKKVLKKVTKKARPKKDSPRGPANIALATLKPNPFRDFTVDPIDDEKVERAEAIGFIGWFLGLLFIGLFREVLITVLHDAERVISQIKGSRVL